MQTLAPCANMFGDKIKPELAKLIKDYIKTPTCDGWDDIKGIIICSDSTTIWQAVLTVDRTFPRTGRREDEKGNIIKEWERIPEPLLVLQAIRNVTS